MIALLTFWKAIPQSIKILLLWAVIFAAVVFSAYYKGRGDQSADDKAHQAKASASASSQASSVAASVETRIVTRTQYIVKAAQEARNAITAAPKPSASCNEAPVINAWRAGLDSVRKAGGSMPRDDSADSASAMSSASGSR